MENDKLFGPILRSAADKRRLIKKEAHRVKDSDVTQITFRVKETGFKRLGSPRITTIREDIVTVHRKSHRLELEGVIGEKPTRMKQLGNDYKDCDLTVLDGSQGKRFESKSGEGQHSGYEPPSVDDRDLKFKTGHMCSLANNHNSKLLESLNSFPLLNTRNRERFEAILLDCQLRERLAVKSSSITNILQKTMSQESIRALEEWKRRMVTQLGEEGFQNYQQELFRVGKSLHRCIEEYLSDKPLDIIKIDDSIRGHWKSLQPILADVSDVSLLETRVHHPVLQYRGILDGVVKYRGAHVLIEWKTSQRPKPRLNDTYDNPLQAAAYIGALNYCGNLPFQLTEAAIVIAYSCGSPAHLHFLNKDLCQYYWNLWLQRFAKFLLIDE